MRKNIASKSLATLFVLSMFWGVAGVSAAETEQAYYNPPLAEAEVGSSFFEVSEHSGFLNGSNIKALEVGNRTYLQSRDCSEPQGKPQCDPGKLSGTWVIDGFIELPVCESETQANCTEPPVFLTADGQSVTAELIGLVDAPANEAWSEYGLPEGSTTKLWKVPGVVHGLGADTYMSSANARYQYDKNKKKFVANEITLSLIPYLLEVDPAFSGTKLTEQQGADGKWQSGATGWSNNRPCAWTEDGACGLTANFPASISATIAVHVPKTIAGWFEGRMKNPTAAVSEISSTQNRLQVTAEPAVISRYLAKVYESEVTAAQKSKLLQITGGSGNDWFQGNSLKGQFSDNDWPLENIELLRDLADDKAYGTSTTWMVKTTYGAFGCFADTSKVLGIVATNAMIYAGGPPKFADGYLNYSVAGMHYTSKGEVVQGTYDLVINSETARCLYGFTNAPVSATVQVLGAGAENVATTVVSEKDGWLKLAAYGFTFSKKNIQVKLTQPYSKTMTKFTGASRSLTSKQKAEIKSTVSRAKGNPKFICTGTYVNPSSKATALARARAACNYAKSLDKSHSYFAQAKQTKAKNYDGKVMLVSK